MNFSKYQNTLPYPKKPVKPSAQKVSSYEVAQEFAEAMKLYEENLITYHISSDNYHAKEQHLYNQFRIDALTEVGLIGHPKADKVFAKAWEDGHANGYQEVFRILEDLAELVL